MRLGAYIECNQCGNTWHHIVGVGYKEIASYCNKCGKEKIEPRNPSDDLRLKNKRGVCECGGVFSISCKVIICPQCQNHINSDVLDDILWD